jgi:hypothetical protein
MLPTPGPAETARNHQQLRTVDCTLYASAVWERVYDILKHAVSLYGSTQNYAQQS